MQKDKKKIGKLQKAVLVRTVIPLLLMGIIIALFTSDRYKKMMYEEMKPMLSSVAASVRAIYDELYEGDYELVGEETVSLYKGEQELTGDFSIIDRMQAEVDMEITLFYKDARILTTLRDAEGARCVATGINSVIYNAMEENPETRFYNVVIDGVEYYACYVPILNSDGSLIGMVGVARQTEQISKAALKALEPIWLITVLCMLFTGYISVNYTQGLVDGIHHIREFLQWMTGGELSHAMNSQILKRTDEIGDAGKSAVAMQNAVRILVERDPLTALYNRRYGTAKLKSIQRQSEKSGVPYALALGDIDFFKKVNDTYGHEAGDVVLTSVANLLRKHLTGKGFVSRWGGEEFLIVFHKFDQKAALEEMRSIVQDIRSMEIPYQGKIITITMTFGLVNGCISEDYEELIRQADLKLYYGKENGRNRIVTEMHDTLAEIPAAERDPEDHIATGDVFVGSPDVKLEEKLSEEEKAAIEQLKQNQMVEDIVRKMAENMIREAEEENEKAEQTKEDGTGKQDNGTE